ncbi:MAG: glycosyltransferase family 4 protein [Armatimonadetes bacterium]|nr:glycosyltransferase family 4 protein [Armatimonadota bacterium]
MRILVITNLCPPDYDGGFELSALRNATSLRARGHEVDIVTSEYRPSYQGDRVDPDWVHRIFKVSEAKDGWSTAEMFLGGTSDLRFKIGNIAKQIGLRLANMRVLTGMLDVAPKNEGAMDRFLAENDYDAAYVFGLHMIGTSVIRSLVKKNIPVLYHHGDEWLAFYLYPGKLKRLMLNLASPITYYRERQIDLRNVYLVSNFMKRRFMDAGFREEQLGVIYRGVEFPLREDFDRERFDPPVFLVASRLTLYKGIHFAIKAASILNKKDSKTPWQLWIAGHGDAGTMEFFRNMVTELGVEHRVQFIGKHSRESTFAHMQRATAVISPSVFDEPFGNTNIEALASGTPLIASRSGAIEEIVEHGKSGLIYERDNADELAHHMQLVLANPELRRTMQIEGMKRIREKFTQDRVIDEVEAKLSSMAGIELTPEAVEAKKATLQ